MISYFANLVILMIFGLLMLFSASYATGFFRKGSSYAFILPQTLYAIAGLVVALVVSCIDYRWIRKWAWPFYYLCLLLLVVVLFMEPISNCRRWINIKHLPTLQVSEMAKFGLILLEAHLMTLHRKRVKTLKYGILIPVFFILPILVLLKFEPHYSAMILMLSILATMMFCSGISWAWIGIAGGAGAALTLGALYSGVCMMPRLRFLGGLLWRIVSLAGMAAIAFGWDKSAWKRSGVFVLLSMALGGASLSIGRGNFLTLLLTAGGVWALCIVAFGGRVGGREYVPVELTYGGKAVSIVALRDSGNTLRDPISGEQVLVVSGEVAEKLTGLTQDQLRAPLKTLMCRPVPGLRLIPYRAVGQAGDMLLAMRFDRVKIGNRTQSAVVAFAAEGLGRGEMVTGSW